MPAQNSGTSSSSSAQKQEQLATVNGKSIFNFAINDALTTYLHTVTNVEPDVCRWIRETTAAKLGIEIRMVPTIDQGRFLTTLAHITNAKLVVEIGVFTGYSSVSFALGMPQDGRFIGLDMSEAYTNYAREAWRRVGVADRFELRLAPAAQSLAQMLTDETLVGNVDLMFIDADKESMPEYYEYAMKLLRPRGVVVLDNTLWYGYVYDANKDDEGTRAIGTVNERIAKDERVFAVQLPLSDGVTVVTKK